MKTSFSKRNKKPKQNGGEKKKTPKKTKLIQTNPSFLGCVFWSIKGARLHYFFVYMSD